MNLSFRQGLVRYEVSQSRPILSVTSLTGNTIDLNVMDSPIVVTFCHYSANYIVEMTRSISAAWGSSTTSNNGPLSPNIA